MDLPVFYDKLIRSACFPPN